MPVPLFDTETPRLPLRADLRSAVHRVLDAGRFVLGPEVQAFEREWAAYLGAAHAIGVANGTEAITIALRALGVGPGDEVVVPSFTFWASAEAIPHTGATPVFCDIDPETFCVTPETVKAAMTPRTKAVIVVHLFGNVAPVAEIEALGVPVLEDAAQAAGSIGPAGRPGALGTVATFSFYPSKNLGAFGDGGAITTRDDDVAQRVRTLRFHGSADKKDYSMVGYNSRLDELQAAILRVQLPELDRWAQARVEAGDRYEQALDGLVGLPRATPGARPAWHLYVVRHPDPDALQAALTERGVACAPYYRRPIHEQPPMRSYAPAHDLPGTAEAARTHLAIPMSAALRAEQVDEVAAAVRDAGLVRPHQ
ncbi:DegT/DnrJ/EryC1/StrS family aminotransferase [Baekduia soli]|uniref:DegT/DnrJ/EryC1/StrS family aminotransferase n=1 Tax=Baekduia soli TaxID=496014 RepID=A0A5B8U1K6_9ACTN|nr:DegT/DnrJ/EryC1/StrS family aminotransferase [Baekduia soli]QEC46881.1 DegT/DnrJ/EryC1/StrS family aminotransferase [Baekduia soli]